MTETDLTEFLKSALTAPRGPRMMYLTEPGIFVRADMGAKCSDDGSVWRDMTDEEYQYVQQFFEKMKSAKNNDLTQSSDYLKLFRKE